MKSNNMHILKGLTAITLILGFTTPALAETVNLKDWTTVADIVSVVPAPAVSAGGDWYLAELPGEVIRKSQSSGRDIRIIDNTNTEIPYVIVKQGTAAPVAGMGDINDGTARIRVTENSMQKGNTGDERVVVLELPVEGRVYNGLDIQVAPNTTNFRKVVHISISDNPLGATSPAWRELETKPIIYSYSDGQGLFVQDTRISFPNASSRYIRLRFAQDERLANAGAQFINNVFITGVRVVYDSFTTEKGITIKNYVAGAWNSDKSIVETAKIDSINQNTQTKTTEVVYSASNPLGFIGMMKVTLKIAQGENNFKRQVMVQGTNEVGTSSVWQTLSSGQIYRIDSPVFQGESLSIAFPPANYLRFRVIIQNNNDAALKIEDPAEVETQKQAVLFKKVDKNISGLKLLVGNRTVAAPTYEIEKTIAYFDTTVPNKVEIINVKDNPLFTTPVDTTPFGEKNKWLLNGGLIVFVILVAILGFRWRAKRIDEKPTDEIPQP